MILSLLPRPRGSARAFLDWKASCWQKGQPPVQERRDGGRRRRSSLSPRSGKVTRLGTTVSSVSQPMSPLLPCEVAWVLSPGVHEADEIDRLKSSTLQRFCTSVFASLRLVKRIRDISASLSIATSLTLPLSLASHPFGTSVSLSVIRPYAPMCQTAPFYA